MQNFIKVLFLIVLVYFSFIPNNAEAKITIEGRSNPDSRTVSSMFRVVEGYDVVDFSKIIFNGDSKPNYLVQFLKRQSKYDYMPSRRNPLVVEIDGIDYSIKDWTLCTDQHVIFNIEPDLAETMKNAQKVLFKVKQLNPTAYNFAVPPKVLAEWKEVIDTE